MTTDNKVNVKLLKLDKKAKLPSYAKVGDSGMDLYYCGENPIVIEPWDREVIPTGIAIELPEGTEAQVRPKSGIALLNGVTVLNTPGTVDQGFRGEIRVIMVNLSKTLYIIEPGNKIAQLVIATVLRAELEVVSELSSSDRQEGGFGSTGLQ